jgi:hypothetical protein
LQALKLTPDPASDIILLSSTDHGDSWQYVSTVIEAGDAQAYGGTSGFVGPALATDSGRTFLLVCPGKAEENNEVHLGTCIFEFADIAQGQLVRDNGTPRLVSWIKHDMYKGGQSDYDEQNTYGGIMMPQLEIEATDLFRVFNTRQSIVGLSPPTVSIGAPSVPVTRAGPVDFEVSFYGSDTVTLAKSDVELITTGSANGSVTVSGTGTASRTVTVNNVTGDGTIAIRIRPGVASDAVSSSAYAGPSDSVTVDNSTTLEKGWNLVIPVADLPLPLSPGAPGPAWRWNDDLQRFELEDDVLAPGTGYWLYSE